MRTLSLEESGRAWGTSGELEIISDVYLILCQSHLATHITSVLEQQLGRPYELLGKVKWYPVVGYSYGSPKALSRVRATRHCGSRTGSASV